MAKLPIEITDAIRLAEEAGWPVSARNGKIIITTPDGMAITVGAKPNDESMKVWRSTIRRYNLHGDGPAMTPDQQEEMAMAAATKSTPKTDPRKEAEIAAAKEKAMAAAAGQGPTPGAPKAPSVPVVTFTAPKAPVATPSVIAKKVAAAVKPKFDKDGFPPFEPQMVVIENGEYSRFLISEGPNKGRLFCPVCWEKGIKAVFKAPQGLAAHRGYRHGAFAATDESLKLPESLGLPEGVRTALELLVGSMVEELTGTVDDGQVKELEETIKDLTVRLQTAEDGFASRGKMLTELEGKIQRLASERDKATTLAAERGTALDQATAKCDAQVQMLLAKFEKDLKQFQQWANELAPYKAVGEIMTVVDKYLTK